jgi:hypothetical protein
MIAAQIVHHGSLRPLPALGADACPRNAAENGGFRRADIVAVEAGYGKGLQDMQFEYFHFNLSLVDSIAK